MPSGACDTRTTLIGAVWPGRTPGHSAATQIPSSRRARPGPMPHRRGASSRSGTPISVCPMDVTDETFQEAVLDRSATVPVIVDLWAPWCGPCKTLGPMIEKAVADTGGAVELAKVNVDDNPAGAQAFNGQPIPAVFAISGGQVVDQFIGAVPEAQVIAFVQRLAPAPSEADTLAATGDEASLRRALELEPDHAAAIEGLARILIDRGEGAEALTLLQRLPETEATRVLAAEARLLEAGVDVSATGREEIEGKLNELLERVRDDDAARQEFVDLLEAMGADNPRTKEYRRRLTARLY